MAEARIRVLWVGPARGHADWPAKHVIVETEDEAKALVAQPMQAGFNQAYAQRENRGSVANYWKTFASRRRSPRRLS